MHQFLDGVTARPDWAVGREDVQILALHEGFAIARTVAEAWLRYGKPNLNRNTATGDRRERDAVAPGSNRAPLFHSHPTPGGSTWHTGYCAVAADMPRSARPISMRHHAILRPVVF